MAVGPKAPETPEAVSSSSKMQQIIGNRNVPLLLNVSLMLVAGGVVIAGVILLAATVPKPMGFCTGQVGSAPFALFHGGMAVGWAVLMVVGWILKKDPKEDQLLALFVAAVILAVQMFWLGGVAAHFTRQSDEERIQAENNVALLGVKPQISAFISMATDKTSFCRDTTFPVNCSVAVLSLVAGLILSFEAVLFCLRRRQTAQNPAAPQTSTNPFDEEAD